MEAKQGSAAKHTPGPLLTSQEAMDIAVLIQMRVTTLRDLCRPAFAAELARMEVLISRFDEWIDTKRAEDESQTVEVCQGCGGTGEYATGLFGRDFCDDCKGCGRVKRTTQTSMGAAIAAATGAAS